MYGCPRANGAYVRNWMQSFFLWVVHAVGSLPHSSQKQSWMGCGPAYKRKAVSFRTSRLVGLGIKVTVGASMAVSFGRIVSLSTATLVGVIMKNSIRNTIGIWCGAALLWRTGVATPPNEIQHCCRDGSLPKSDAGRFDSSPPHHNSSMELEDGTQMLGAVPHSSRFWLEWGRVQPVS